MVRLLIGGDRAAFHLPPVSLVLLDVDALGHFYTLVVPKVFLVFKSLKFIVEKLLFLL